MRKTNRQAAWLLVATAIALGTSASGAHASGFQLIEQNGSGLGNAFSGQAAAAEDASAVFFNPAGLTRIPGRQVVGALHLIGTSNDFRDGGSTPATLQPTAGRYGWRRRRPGVRSQRLLLLRGAPRDALGWHRSERSVRPQDGVGFRLGGALPRDQVGGHDDQHQPDRGVEGHALALGRRGRELPADRRRADELGQLQRDRVRHRRRAGSRRAGGGGLWHRRRGLRGVGNGRGRRLELGLERRRAVRGADEDARRACRTGPG